MAAKKKAKAKRKAAKKKSGKKVARKKVTRRATKKKIAVKKRTKAKAKKRKPVAKVAPTAVAPPAGERIGIVTHYFTHLTVAIVQLESGSLREGDIIHIKGHTSDFSQRVDSMELDHVHVTEVYAGQSVGLRVKDHAREHDVVYKVM